MVRRQQQLRLIFDADNSLGSVSITDNYQDAVDTLDFSPTQTAPVTVNLATTIAQSVDANLTLTLASASLITDVIGGGRQQDRHHRQ